MVHNCCSFHKTDGEMCGIQTDYVASLHSNIHNEIRFIIQIKLENIAFKLQLYSFLSYHVTLLILYIFGLVVLAIKWLVYIIASCALSRENLLSFSN